MKQLLLIALALLAAGASSGELPERKGLVARKGTPLTLLGPELKVGDQAPDFEAVGTNMKPVRLSAFRGKTVVLSAVPSLDTPVCSVETRKFNEHASQLGDGVVVLTVSMDLPFAQKRWCGAHGIKRVITVSDHRDAAFGKAYGVLIEGARLLARAVFVVDKEGIIRYTQLVPELTSEPDYKDVLAAVRKLAP